MQLVFDRMWRWMTEQVAFLAVVVIIAVGFCYLLVEPGRWGRASGVIAVAVIAAGLLRAVLPSGRAGLLAVRSRWLDTALLLAVGGVVLAVDIRLHG